MSNPSSENVLSYQWISGRFVEQDNTRTDYATLGGDESATPDG